MGCDVQLASVGSVQEGKSEENCPGEYPGRNFPRGICLWEICVGQMSGGIRLGKFLGTVQGVCLGNFPGGICPCNVQG